MEEWKDINAAITARIDAAREAAKTEGLSKDEADKVVNAAIAEELKSMERSVRQFIHDGGHRQATAQASEKITALEDEKKKLETDKSDLATEVSDLKTKVEELENEKPDVEAVKKQLNADFEKVEKKLKDDNAELQAEIDELKTERKRDKVETFVASVSSRVGPAMTEDGEEWMRTRLKSMQIDGRIVLNESNDEGALPVSVKRPDAAELDYHAADMAELVDTVAEEIVTAAPKWARNSKVDSGGGSKSDRGGKGGGNKWDKIREGAKERAGQNKESDEVKNRRANLLPQA